MVIPVLRFEIPKEKWRTTERRHLEYFARWRPIPSWLVLSHIAMATGNANTKTRGKDGNLSVGNIMIIKASQAIGAEEVSL